MAGADGGSRAEVVGPGDVERAAHRIAGRVRTTPVVDAGDDRGRLPQPVVLKLELVQHTGSFKPRGVFNWMLSQDGGLPSAGVVAASGGNAGAAFAYVARELGVPATIVVPEVTSVVKRRRLADLGAEVVVVPGVYNDALAASRDLAARTGARLGHAYDDPDIVAGQGTCGRELERQAGAAFDTVLVAVGGAGLIGGIAAWFGGRKRVVGVEPEPIPALHEALAADRPVDVEVSGLAADSLGASRVGEVPFAVARRHVDRSVLVPDDGIARAQRDLWARFRIAAEPGGAAAWAALLDEAYVPEPGERVAVVVCGGNVDLTTLT